jgi:hypothetical protein
MTRVSKTKDAGKDVSLLWTRVIREELPLSFIANFYSVYFENIQEPPFISSKGEEMEQKVIDYVAWFW